ncbi:MAG: alpha/beta hydrolase [Clostridia bacterium]|nr:alpha/beta hydrolase [Clostridia bacterium]
MMKTLQMWDKIPALDGEAPVLEYYPAENKKTDAAVVIFPGGGYAHRAKHEGEGYALFLNSIGMDAFVCEYRVSPYRFPVPLLDARRAVRYVRANAEVFGLSPEKIAVMGSSAGGHLAALVSTYTDPIEYETDDAVDALSPIPNATILCYPVCHQPDESKVAHVGSYLNLMGEDKEYAKVSPDLLVSDTTPTAFIWHTSDDAGVNVINSYLYASALRRHNISHEMHIFPKGPHGLGLAEKLPHVAQWAPLMKNWFAEIGWLIKE